MWIVALLFSLSLSAFFFLSFTIKCVTKFSGRSRHLAREGNHVADPDIQLGRGKFNVSQYLMFISSLEEGKV